jgi:hypothetical protein
MEVWGCIRLAEVRRVLGSLLLLLLRELLWLLWLLWGLLGLRLALLCGVEVRRESMLRVLLMCRMSLLLRLG